MLFEMGAQSASIEASMLNTFEALRITGWLARSSRCRSYMSTGGQGEYATSSAD